MKFLLPIIAACLLLACGGPPSLKNQLAGKWKLQTVTDGDKNVTEQHNPKGNRWIDLDAAGTFVSDGDPFGKNTGTWNVLEEDNTEVLHLDSDAGEGDDSYWLVTFSETDMAWQGTRSEFTERFRLTYHKARE